MRWTGIWVGLGALAVLMLPFVALAQNSTNVGPTVGITLLDNIRQESGQVFGRLTAAAEGLLLTLATLSLAWKAMHLVLRNADMQEFVTEIFQLVLVVGFYLVVIRNARPWTEALTQGFLWLGNTSMGGSYTQNLSPVGILQQGIDVASDLVGSASVWNMIQYLVVAIAVGSLYALVAAYAAVVQCEVWLVVAAGMIFLGFGGSDWTADYAKRYLTYCLSASAKLYLLYLIIGFGQQSIHNWINDLDRSSLAVMMGPVALLVVWAVLVIQLPNILQSLLNGVALHGGAPMLMGMGASMAKSAVMAAASAATVGAAGGAMAVSEAAKLATTQLGTGAAAVMGGAASSSPSGGQVLGQTLSNLGSGVMGMAGGHIMQSTMGGRIAQNLHARRMASEMDLGSGSGSYSGVVSPAPESSQPYVSPAHQRE